jgi:hypothetical protein
MTRSHGRPKQERKLKSMNKPNINKKPWRGAVGLWTIAALAGALLLVTTGVASADYGRAVYQIEVTSNDGIGGGVWLWIALYQDGTGDYAGSDCAGGNNRYLRGEGARPDHGDVTSWYHIGPYTNPCSGETYPDAIVINGVALNGLGGFPTTITVPAAYGHYSSPGTRAFMTLPCPPVCTCGGSTQLQIAP